MLDVHIGKPDNLYLLYLLPILLIFGLGVWYVKNRLRPLITKGSRYPLIGTLKLWLIMVIALGSFMLAYSEPFLSEGSVSLNRGNVEIIFVLDSSSSMFLKDTGWSRIDIAVREMMNLFSRQIIRDGDKVSLYVFGRTALRRVHLTGDLNRVINDLSKLGRPNKLLGSDLYWGSDIVATLTRVYESLDRQEMMMEFDGREVENWQLRPKGNRLVIIFTDGDYEIIEPSQDEENNGQDRGFDYVLGEFRERGLKIYPIGVGTRHGAALTEILNDYTSINDYPSTLRNDLEGQISRLNSINLEYLRNNTGGKGPFLIEYVDVSAGRFLESMINSHRSTSVEPALNQEKQDLWPYFAIAGLVVFLVAIILH